jgi:hypothetical protein
MRSSARYFVLALVSGVLACSSNDGKEPVRNGSGGAGNGAAGNGAAGNGGAATSGAGGTPGAGGTSGGGASGSDSAGRGNGSSGRQQGKAGSATAGLGGASASGGQAGVATSPAGSGGTITEEGTTTIFWLDVGGKVLASDATNFAMRTLVRSAGQGSDGIAVDVPAGFIYWTDMGVPADDDGSIMRSNLDGSNVTTVVPKGGTYTPKQLKLVPEQGKLYWSDREGMRVMRSNVDGSDIEILYQSGSTASDRQDNSRWCVGIAVDAAGGYFYWSQKGTDNGHEGSIRRAHLALPAGDTPQDRSDVEILFDGEAATCDIDLDREAGLIYWANRGDDSINRGPLELPSGATAATRTDKQTIVNEVDQAIGVFLDHPRGLVYYTDAVGDVGRASFDGSDAKFLLTDAGAFTGIVVADLPK